MVLRARMGQHDCPRTRRNARCARGDLRGRVGVAGDSLRPARRVIDGHRSFRHRRHREGDARRSRTSVRAETRRPPVIAALLFATAIPQMLRQIDARHCEKIVSTLVSFGTRNTLSAQDDPKRGIGAARDWIYGQFQDIAKTSDGRMTVELQSYEQQPGNRIPSPTKITDVVATLRGTQSPDRIYVIS